VFGREGPGHLGDEFDRKRFRQREGEIPVGAAVGRQFPVQLGAALHGRIDPDVVFERSHMEEDPVDTIRRHSVGKAPDRVGDLALHGFADRLEQGLDARGLGRDVVLVAREGGSRRFLSCHADLPSLDSFLAASSAPLAGAALLAAGYAAYLFWYSRFPARTGSRIRRGLPLPEFTARRLDGTEVSSRDLMGSPALLVFYRGNWCPLCVTQVKDIAKNYRKLSERGIRTVLVSPQSQEHTSDLAERFDAPMEFWIDEGLAAARALGIADIGGLPAGMGILGYENDTVLPTSILVDADGVVFHDDQTDSYRIRPEPEDYLAAFDKRGA